MAAGLGQQDSSEPGSTSGHPVARRPWSVDTVIETGILSVLLGGVLGLPVMALVALGWSDTTDHGEVTWSSSSGGERVSDEGLMWAAFAAHMTTWGILAVVPTRWRGFARFLDWVGVLFSPIFGLVVIGLGGAVGWGAYRLAAPAPRSINGAWPATYDIPAASEFAITAGVIASAVGCALYLILPNLMQGADRLAFLWLRRRARANARRTHA